MVQAPAATKVAEFCETVQTAGVAELKVTGKPEVAVALRGADAPTCWVGMAVKVMVCDIRPRNLAVNTRRRHGRGDGP